jgi:lipopolysaccharide transport system ATP-binding protein
MSRPIIECERLSKRYRLGKLGGQGLWSGATLTLRDKVTETMRTATAGLQKLWRRPPSQAVTKEESQVNEFWALRDVSLEVERGEVIGIIGRNGAGKSTLLKILSRIVEPTSGRARLRGRSASLLEVGTGFHPELSGRENIYLNGAILGMRRAEVTRKFDEIVAFSEIEKFLDTPVKRYSSGMYVRLAFAVAAHLEPEILIVDEVLAVGDFAFQKKCLGKMNEVATEEGRTILFISHHMATLTQLCNRGILLEGGEITASGPIRDIVKQYLRSGLNEETAYAKFPLDDSKPCQFLSVELLHEDGLVASEFSTLELLTIRVRFLVREWGSARTLTMTIQTLEGVMVVFSDFRDGNPSMAELLGVGEHTFEIPVAAQLLAPTTYVVNVHCISEFHGPIEERFSCCEFTLRDLDNTRQFRPGLLGTNMPWIHRHEVAYAQNNGARA